MPKTLAERMYLRSGDRMLLAGYAAALAPPEGVVVSDDPAGTFDVIQVFLSTRTALEADLPRLKPLLAAGGKLWVTYPKGTSKRPHRRHRPRRYPSLHSNHRPPNRRAGLRRRRLVGDQVQGGGLKRSNAR